MKWLQRYLDEKELTLKNFAKAVRSLEERSPGWRSPSSAKERWARLRR